MSGWGGWGELMNEQMNKRLEGWVLEWLLPAERCLPLVAGACLLVEPMGQQATPLIGQHMAPLMGQHMAPLMGQHMAPLMGQHMAPLTAAGHQQPQPPPAQAACCQGTLPLH